MKIRIRWAIFFFESSAVQTWRTPPKSSLTVTNRKFSVFFIKKKKKSYLFDDFVAFRLGGSDGVVIYVHTESLSFSRSGLPSKTIDIETMSQRKLRYTTVIMTAVAAADLRAGTYTRIYIHFSSPSRKQRKNNESDTKGECLLFSR